jgi:hypothetical protein
VVLTGRFETKIRPRLEASSISPSARAQIQKELPKMAGAALDSVAVDPQTRAAVGGEINDAFLAGFHIVMIEAAVLAMIAGGFGAAIGETSERARKDGSGRRSAA